MEESYEGALAALQEKEKRLEVIIATAQRDHDTTIAREVANALAAAGVNVLPEKGKAVKKGKKDEDKKNRQKEIRPHSHATLASVPESCVASTGSKSGRQMTNTGQGPATPGEPPVGDERRGEDRKGNPRKPVKKRTPVPPDDDPDESPEDDDGDSDEEDEEEEEDSEENGDGKDEEEEEKKKKKG